MSNTRLTVVVRKDLQLPDGLLAAQVSHAANEFIRKAIISGLQQSTNDDMNIVNVLNQSQLDWIQQPYMSVLAVNTYEELVHIERQAMEANLPMHQWFDVVPSKTLEMPMKCYVGIAIGPADFDAIKLVTGKLPLY